MTTFTQRIIRENSETLRVEGYGLPLASRQSVQRVFGLVPDRSYIVTYTIDPDGDYMVDESSTCGGYIIRHIRNDYRVVVCFIPTLAGWLGKRISRRTDYD